jgi:hypothetical protein
MFRTVFPSIIRSPRLYTQHQVYVIQFSWLLASRHGKELIHPVPNSKQSTNLYDIYLMLCVQFWTPDNGRIDHPKHVEWSLMSHRACCHTCYTIQFMHYSHFKTHLLRHLKSIHLIYLIWVICCFAYRGTTNQWTQPTLRTSTALTHITKQFTSRSPTDKNTKHAQVSLVFFRSNVSLFISWILWTPWKLF